MKKSIFLPSSILFIGLSLLGQNALADVFYADVLNNGIEANASYSTGDVVSTFDLSSVTIGKPSHIKISYECKIKYGLNYVTYTANNSVTFRDVQNSSILSIKGCDIIGSDNPLNEKGSRIIPIPVGTFSLMLNAQNSGSDASNQATNSLVSVEILGRKHLPIDFNTSVFHDFSTINNSSQNVSDNYVVEDSGATLHLEENTWKAIDYSYTVTSDTVLEFDYYSTSEGDMQGIGFSNALNLPIDNMFLLYGSQGVAQAINSYKTYAGNEGTWVHYKINVGSHYVGSFNYMFLLNDDDSTTPTSNGYFKNIKVYEE